MSFDVSGTSSTFQYNVGQPATLTTFPGASNRFSVGCGRGFFAGDGAGVCTVTGTFALVVTSTGSQTITVTPKFTNATGGSTAVFPMNGVLIQAY